MAKIVYIIPGLGESIEDKRYAGVVELFAKKGFKIIPVRITWKNRVMSDYVKESLLQFNQHTDKDEIYLFGFSFGAIISFVASPQINPKMQFLCSLSPYFKEDLPTIKEWWKKFMGKNRINDFETLSFDDISEKVKCKTYIFAGTSEGPEVVRRAKSAKKQIEGSELFMIDGAKHDISQDVYADKLVEVISGIK